MELYDPLRPNDYNEYKVWRTKERIDRRERVAEQRRAEERKRSRRSASCSDSEGTGSDEDDRPRKAGKLSSIHDSFPYPYVSSTGRYETFDRWSRGRPETEEHDVPMPDAPPIAVDRNLTGDEAFQRRLAMSQRARSPPLTESPHPPPAHTLQDEPKPHIPPPTETGEEAYLRRLAMSTLNRSAAPAAPPPPPPVPMYTTPPVQQDRPRSVSPPPLAFNPFAPPSVPPPPPGPPAAIPSAFEEKIKAAAAIAAKLSALGAGAAATASSSTLTRQPTPPVEEKKYVHSNVLCYLWYSDGPCSPDLIHTALLRD